MNVFTLFNLIVLLTNIAVSVFVFRILARQAGLAMGNARLYRELQRKVETLGRIVQEWQDTQSKHIQTEKIASMGMMAASLTHAGRGHFLFTLHIFYVKLFTFRQYLGSLVSKLSPWIPTIKSF